MWGLTVRLAAGSVYFLPNYSIPKKHDGTEGEAMSKLKQYSRKDIGVMAVAIFLVGALVLQIFLVFIS